MSDNGNDIFSRLTLVIDDWSAQIARSHEELSAQIGVARGHLDKLLHQPASGTTAEEPGAAEERSALEAEIEGLREELESVRAAAARQPAETPPAPSDGELTQLRETLQLRDTMVASLQEQLDDALAEQTRLREALEDARASAEMAAAETGAEDSDTAMDSRAREDLDQRDAEIAALREELAAAHREIEARAAQRSAGQDGEGAKADANADTLRATLEMLQLEHAAAQDEIRSLKQDLDHHRVAPGSIDAFDAKGHKKRMGEILVELGVLSEVQLKSILREQSSEPQRRLGSLAVEHGFATDELISRILAAQLRLPYEDLEAIEPDPGALEKVSSHVVSLHRCMPIQEDDGELTVAMVNPLDLIAIEDLELASGCRVAPVVATREKIDALLDIHYPEA